MRFPSLPSSRRGTVSEEVEPQRCPCEARAGDKGIAEVEVQGEEAAALTLTGFDYVPIRRRRQPLDADGRLVMTCLAEQLLNEAPPGSRPA